MSAQRSHRPWPLKWILVAILVVIVPYTYLRWHYRKPGPAFEPYHDIKDRANTMRLLAAGFQRITVEADRPADPLRAAASATITAAPGGLPTALDATLVDKPILPSDIVSVVAAPTANTMFSYPIDVRCLLPDLKEQPAGAHLYVRGEEVYILPLLEQLDGSLLSRNRDNLVRLIVPAGTLKPGHYRVTLVGSQSSRAWRLEVR
ncbi:hypothetical protein [Opitutus terrae]|nr:hypothetical protein [Opitutus terrae]